MYASSIHVTLGVASDHVGILIIINMFELACLLLLMYHKLFEIMGISILL